jgi:type I restriction enzyme M protein
MAIKKSQLYSSLWESCDELRGGMDGMPYPASMRYMEN